MKNIFFIFSIFTLLCIACIAKSQQNQENYTYIHPEQKSVDLSESPDYNAQLIQIKEIDPNFIKENVDEIEQFRQQALETEKTSREAEQKQIDDLQLAQKMLAHSLYTGYNNETNKIDAVAAQIEFNKKRRESLPEIVIKDTKLYGTNWIHDIVDSFNEKDVNFGQSTDIGGFRANNSLENAIRDNLSKNQASWVGQLSAFLDTDFGKVAGTLTPILHVPGAALESLNQFYSFFGDYRKVEAYKEDPNFDSGKFAEERFRLFGKSDLEGKDEKSSKRIMSSRSKEEYVHEWIRSEWLRTDNEKLQKNFVGEIVAGFSEFGSVPIKLFTIIFILILFCYKNSIS